MRALVYIEDGAGLPLEMLRDHSLLVSSTPIYVSLPNHMDSSSVVLRSPRDTSLDCQITTRPHGSRTS
jgi:hypothetical protein